jgi:predicted ATP-dependent endonuclease of OLD family
MMQKIDQMKMEIKDGETGETKEIEKPVEKKLLSQNISIIEVGGAFAHKFKNMLNFLDIKTLIITDLDSVGANNKKCKVEEGVKTCNKAITDYLGNISLEKLVNLPANDKIVDELFRIAYQIPEEDGSYCARSFEDSWLEINREFINYESTSLNDFPHNVEESKSSYDLADKIKKKTKFALDIIFSTKEENQWNTPRYIREGLKWLAN